MGQQEPRVKHLPANAVGSLGPKAAALAARCGRKLDGWQRIVLDGAMSRTSSGLWAAADVDLIASRQNGKNGAVEVRELYGAVFLGEWFIHTAHQFKTTKESYAKLLELIEADDEVRARLLSKVASPASGYEMRFKGGGRVQFIARSRTSGRGLTGDVLVLDEAQELDDDMLGAILPTISAGPAGNPQTWYQGSAPGPLALVWQRRRTSGRAGGDGSRAYFEFSADPTRDLDDPAAWAEANPALGGRLMLSVIEAERRAMSDDMFARERLSVSPELGDGSQWVIPSEAWAACLDADSSFDGTPCFAVDVTPDRSMSSIAAAGIRADGRPHVEVVSNMPGTSWVVPRLVELVARWSPRSIVLDATGPAGSLIAPLADAGVDVTVVSARDHAHACGLIYDLSVDGTLRHRDEPLLTTALAGAEQRAMADAWLWSRRQSTVDISPLVAATLALGAAAEPAPESSPVFAY